MERVAHLRPDLPPVCRLGLATRGNAAVTAADALHALDRGVNYWNWCGHPDGMCQAVRQLGARRRGIVLATQIEARTRAQAREEFESALEALGTGYLDVATLYHVEAEHEWNQIQTQGGWDYLAEQKQAGRLRAIGLTTHQRPLAAQWAGAGKLDMLMVRYNAAHRGAEREVFPLTDELKLPVVTFTALRWRALVAAGVTASECYRFCLAEPRISVVLAAPANRSELDETLSLLDDWNPPSTADRDAIRAHGDHIRRTAGTFW